MIKKVIKSFIQPAPGWKRQLIDRTTQVGLNKGQILIQSPDWIIKQKSSMIGPV